MLLVFLFCLSSISSEDFRTWTGSNGKELEARFLNRSGNSVTLLTTSGKQLTTTLQNLSPADQAYLRSLKPPLDFKGIKLGMTRRQVTALVSRSQDWQYDRKVAATGGLLVLKANPNASHRFRGVGVKGTTEHQEWFNWHRVTVEFQSGQVYNIGVAGTPFSMTQLDAYLKQWLTVARESIIAKYGAPTKNLLPINDIMPDSFKEGFYVYIDGWGLDSKQEIRLGISAYQDQCSGVIEYVNKDLEATKGSSTRIQSVL